MARKDTPPAKDAFVDLQNQATALFQSKVDKLLLEKGELTATFPVDTSQVKEIAINIDLEKKKVFFSMHERKGGNTLGDRRVVWTLKSETNKLEYQTTEVYNPSIKEEKWEPPTFGQQVHEGTLVKALQFCPGIYIS